ncbi:MAG: histidine kinase [Opitutaceae bacterium]|nr:histidine kinase [Opitutaceae bacterium]
MSWSLLPVLLVAVAVVFAFQLLVVNPFVDLRSALWFTSFQTWPWLLLAPLIWWLSYRVQIGVQPWRKALAIHALACLVSVTVYTGVSHVAFSTGWLRPSGMRDFRRHTGDLARNAGSMPRPPPGPPPGQPGKVMMWMRQIRTVVPVHLVLVAGAHAFLFFRRSQERENRALQAESQLAQARLLALQSQLQPHFLFNTLNAISALIATAPKDADRVLCLLSDLLRQVLASSQRTEVPLAEELDLVDKYLAIQLVRHSDRLSIVCRVEPLANAAAIPPLILQHFVENSIKHGLSASSCPAEVTLEAGIVEDRLVVTVTDMLLPGKEGVPGARGGINGLGLGLANTRERLRTLYGDRFRLDVAPAPNATGTTVRLEIPYRELRE